MLERLASLFHQVVHSLVNFTKWYIFGAMTMPLTHNETVATPQTPAEIEAAIQALGPELTARAEEAEVARRPPKDLFAKLAATGIFRMLWPAERGGMGFSVPAALTPIETLAAADGSAGWSTMIGVESAALWMRFDPAIPTARSPQHGVLTRACLMPRGIATETSDGWRLKGRWPLASGAYDADWFVASGMVARADGSPDIRLFAVPSERVEIVDTWRALGLRSTMSHDAVIDTVLPSHHVAPSGGVIDSPHPLGRLPLWLALGPFHCAVILGIVRGALGDVVALLPGKRPVLNPVIATSEDPIVQHAIGAAATRLAAARAFVMTETDAAWTMAENKDPFTTIVRVRFRSMLTFVHAECVAIMDQLFHLAGTTPLYDGSPLQRRYRDLRTACQHVTASSEVYRPYGALLMGLTPANEAAL